MYLDMDDVQSSGSFWTQWSAALTEDDKRKMDILGTLSVISLQREIICDFLFASLYTRVLWK